MVRPPNGILPFNSSDLHNDDARKTLSSGPSLPCRNNNLGAGVGEWIRRDRKNTSCHGWSTQRLPSVCRPSPQELQTCSRPTWLGGLQGLIPSRLKVVLSFLLPCSNQTPTIRRLRPTKCPINLDLFRYFSGGGGRRTVYQRIYPLSCVILFELCYYYCSTQSWEFFFSSSSASYFYCCSCDLTCVAHAFSASISLWKPWDTILACQPGS